MPRNYERPRMPQNWSGEARNFYLGLIEVFDRLHLPVEESWLSNELRKKIADNKPKELNYSTEEQDTGRTYIDGQPVYCKTLIFNLADGVWASEAIDGCTQVINFEGFMSRKTNNAVLPANCYYSATINSTTYQTSNIIRARFVGSGGATAHITVYYLKGVAPRTMLNAVNDTE